MRCACTTHLSLLRYREVRGISDGDDKPLRENGGELVGEAIVEPILDIELRTQDGEVISNRLLE